MPTLPPSTTTRATSPRGQLSALDIEFCRQYLLTLSGHRAAVYCRPELTTLSAKKWGTTQLARPEIQEEIADAFMREREKLRVTVDEVLSEIRAMAKVDIRDLFQPDTNALLPIDSMPEAARRAIVGFEVRELFTGEGEGRRIAGYIKSVKLANKLDAAKALGQLGGMFKEKLEDPSTNASATGSDIELAARINALLLEVQTRVANDENLNSDGIV